MEINFLGFSFSLTWFLVGAIFIIYICNDLWIRSYWTRHGFKSPKSVPIFGNTLQWTKGIQHAFLDYFKKQGTVFGVYDFHRPGLCITDLDLLRNIMVKDFGSFTNRWATPLLNKDLLDALFFSKDDHWKGIRNIITPTFSAAKMKLMSPLINKCADRLLKHLEKHQKIHGNIECRELVGAFVMDTIASCAFGLNVDCQENRHHPFVTNAKKAFAGNTFSSPLLVIVSLFPWTLPILEYLDFNIIDRKSTTFFADIVRKTSAVRRESKKSDGEKRIDYLQLLLDAQMRDITGNNKNKADGIHGDPEDEAIDEGGLQKKSSSKIRLNESEVISQALIFFLAGYETTNTTCGYMLYLLATHPDVQDKLVNEIDDVAPEAEDVGYQSISKMPYLEQIFCETERIYPPALMTDRVCNEPFDINGFTVPKGMRIFIPIFTIHHDPNLWPDPETYDPDRFSKENREKHHPCAWMPFGTGPRNCVGMRFAMMEAKMVIVRILQKYQIETCPQTEIPPKQGTNGLISPPNGITLRAVKRN
eukprot:XP_782215.3 PREDICTED: cytochrome P450 3A24 [Strongylocentrotus purpuratus]